MKKIKLPVAVIGCLLLLSLVFGAGVYASQWLSFTGDNKVEQSKNDVNEIMEILRNVNDDKLTAEQALAELQKLDPHGLKQKNEQLNNEVANLRDQLEQKQVEIEQKIAEIQEKIDEGNRKVAEKQAELDRVAQERDSNKQRADQLQQQIDENSNYVAHLKQELQRANEKVQEHSELTQSAVEEARSYK